MSRPKFGGSTLKQTGMTVSEAAAGLKSEGASSKNLKVASKDLLTAKAKADILSTAASEVESEMGKPATPSLSVKNETASSPANVSKSSTSAEIESAASILAGQSSKKVEGVELASVSSSSKPLPLAKKTGPHRPAATLAKSVRIKAPASHKSKRAEEDEDEVLASSRGSGETNKGALPSDKSDKEIDKQKEAEESIDKKRRQLETRNVTSLEEAKSRQRRALEQRNSMNIRLKIPDEDQPMLRAAATGDVATLESCARAYARGSSGGGKGQLGSTFDTLSAVNQTSGIAALRVDRNTQISALHYAAFFHQSMAVKKLLDLAVEPIMRGAKLEIGELVQKRQRFLEDSRYAMQQAKGNSLSGASKGNHAEAEVIKSDADAYSKWCNGEITRVLRARELRCEERWKLCLTATDKMGRTPLMFACSEIGADDVVKTMLTNGRACLSATSPEEVDVNAFMNGAKLDHKVNSSSSKRKMSKKSLSSPSRKFVPPPCNTSKFTGMTDLMATLNAAVSGKKKSATALFPRDESFHKKTGQIKRRRTRDWEGKAPPGGRLNGAETSKGHQGDPVSWLCGRLLGATLRTKSKKVKGGNGSQRRKSEQQQRLMKLFKRYDRLDCGSVEVSTFKDLLKDADVSADDEVVASVCEQFRNVHNRTLTIKYADLVAWTVDNCAPIDRWAKKEEEDEEEEEEKNSGEDGKEADEAKEEDEEGGEEKKEEEEKEEGRSGGDTFFIGSGGMENNSDFIDVGQIREARCSEVINVVDHAKRTALHIASAIGDAITVKILVKHGASREARAEDGESALSYAGTKIVRTTLLNSLLRELEDAKHTHSKRNKLRDWIVMLGEGGLNVNDPLGGLDLQTPLHIAAIAGLDEVVKMLLEKRANVDCGDENGWTPLHHCAVRGGKERRKVAEIILSSGGCQVDSRCV